MPRFAANLSTLFTERPFIERFAAAAAGGFSAVECQFPYAEPAARIGVELERTGLGLVLFNLPPGDWAAGERGLAAVPDRLAEFRESLDLALGYARELRCGLLHCMAGIVPEGISPGDAEATYVENLRLAAAKAAPHGITITIEPINPVDMPGYFLKSMDQAARILYRVGAENLALQYDLYHQSMTAGAHVETYRRHQARIAHIQIAGCPGRHEPDTGTVGYGPILAAIGAMGYAGHVGCEYLPRARTEDGLGWIEAYGRQGR